VLDDQVSFLDLLKLSDYATADSYEAAPIRYAEASRSYGP